MSDQAPQFDPQGFTNDSYVKKNPKPWGYELIFATEDTPYMIKLMHVKAGTRQSLQVHDAKQETYVLIKGEAKVEWENNQGEMIFTELQQFVGFKTTIGQKHRLYGVTDCDIMEGSTPETGTTWRLHDDYARPDETPKQRKKERGEA
jgi:mannose-6-phosphate isomerase